MEPGFSIFNSTLDGQIRELWTSADEQILANVEHFHVIRWELKLQKLTIMLPIWQTTYSIELPKNDTSVSEQGPKVPRIRRELRIAKVTTILGEERSLLANAGTRCRAP